MLGIRRRLLRGALGGAALGIGAGLPALARAAVPDEGNAAAEALLRRGGVVVAFRHALAPGTFDPPEFRMGDCRTQRNLSEEGREQARRIGAWFRERGLQPERVRSSPWCRCIDTAQLAFGQAPAWPALGSPRGATEATNAASLGALRQAVAQAAARKGFEAWVTHMFVLQDLTGEGTTSGEALLLQPDGRGSVRVAGRLRVPA